MAHSTGGEPTPSPPSSPTNEGKSLLRFLTCGSVDDGKSTLIGRLLYNSKKLFEDQLATLQSESQKFGTTDGDIDFALLVDGLVAEREQGITIDVAYRYFATDRRRFIVADTPGHEQYTRNMATGASNSDLAVLLVDAQHGILTQTRRHAYIVSLLGIRNVVLAVNKIDLIGFDEERFIDIRNAFAEFAAQFKFDSIVTIPLSARYGDNVIDRSAEHAVVRRPDAARLPRDGEGRGRERPRSRSASRCSGSTGRTRPSAAMPAPSPPATSGPATASWWRGPARRRAWRGSSPSTATASAPTPAPA